MKPAPFHYHDPTSVEETLTLLKQLDETKLLAGGQSLMPMMNFRYLSPRHVVDLNRVAELTGIEHRDKALIVGAMTRQSTLLKCRQVRSQLSVMGEALAHVGHVQTRNRGTLGGSLCHLDPAAELPALMLALDAELEVASHQQPRRHIPIADWAHGYMTPNLNHDELLVSIRIPLPSLTPRFGFHELARRHGDFALAGAVVHLSECDEKIEDARIALFGVAPTPIRIFEAEQCLTGHALSCERIAEASRVALSVDAIDDVHASSQYRQRMASVVVRRALEQCRSQP